MAREYSLTSFGEKMLSEEMLGESIPPASKTIDKTEFDGYLETRDLENTSGISVDYRRAIRKITVYSKVNSDNEKITVLEFFKTYVVAEEFIRTGTNPSGIGVDLFGGNPNPDRANANRKVRITFFISGAGIVYSGKMFVDEVVYGYVGQNDSIASSDKSVQKYDFKINGTFLENLKSKKKIYELRKEELFILKLVMKVNKENDIDFPKLLAQDIIEQKNQILSILGLVPVPASTPKLIKWFVDGLFAILDISDATGLSTLTDDNIEEFLKVKGIEIFYSRYEEGGAMFKDTDGISHNELYLPDFKDYVKKK